MVIGGTVRTHGNHYTNGNAERGFGVSVNVYYGM